MSDVCADFKKSKRLLNSGQYRIVLRKGKKLFHPLFLLFLLPNHQTQSRLGITVSKKVSKRAVDRNRIKRQAREFFRKNQNTLPKYDVVMIANPKVAHTDNKSIQQALKNIWLKAGRR